MVAERLGITKIKFSTALKKERRLAIKVAYSKTALAMTSKHYCLPKTRSPRVLDRIMAGPLGLIPN
jgi:hypothetical protein